MLKRSGDEALTAYIRATALRIVGCSIGLTCILVWKHGQLIVVYDEWDGGLTLTQSAGEVAKVAIIAALAPVLISTPST
jgi:hypothetical protein